MGQGNERRRKEGNAVVHSVSLYLSLFQRYGQNTVSARFSVDETPNIWKKLLKARFLFLNWNQGNYIFFLILGTQTRTSSSRKLIFQGKFQPLNKKPLKSIYISASYLLGSIPDRYDRYALQFHSLIVPSMWYVSMNLLIYYEHARQANRWVNLPHAPHTD